MLYKYININDYSINPLTSPGEVVSVFTSPYLSAGAPALGEAKGLMTKNMKKKKDKKKMVNKRLFDTKKVIALAKANFQNVINVYV